MEKEEEDIKDDGRAMERRYRSDSVSNVDELIRKKREREKMENRQECFLAEIFRRSKKTPRSPKGGDEIKIRIEGEEMAKEKDEGLRDILEMWKKEILEGIIEQGKMTREETEKIREEIRELRERDEKWKKEKEEMIERIGKLEERLKLLEENKDEKKGENKEGIRNSDMGDKIKEIEKRMELKEREDRKKNFIVRGIEIKDEKKKEAVEELLKGIGVNVDIKEVKNIGRNIERGGEMVWVRLENESQRREIWEKKSKLKGRKERILEDWTWKEKRMRWKLVEIARKEEREGRSLRIGYGKIRINEQWWKWDEEEEILRDGKGNIRIEEYGKRTEEEMETIE